MGKGSEKEDDKADDGSQQLDFFEKQMFPGIEVGTFLFLITRLDAFILIANCNSFMFNSKLKYFSCSIRPFKFKMLGINYNSILAIFLFLTRNVSARFTKS